MNHASARIWFFTDIHGSSACFRKFLRTVENENKPNVLIVGADITGKITIPIVNDGAGHIIARIEDEEIVLPEGDSNVLKNSLSDIGAYAFECDIHQLRNFAFDSEFQNNISHRLIKERLIEWVNLADAQLPSSQECQVFINAGNDDPYFVDSILDKSSKLIRPEGKVIDLPCGLKLLSTGYSTPTPWNCPRELKEELLEKTIASMTSALSPRDQSRSIFNFHCPPKDTSLDLADEIDSSSLRKIAGLKGSSKIHVGSLAVRKSIVNLQPLVGLHGHIHEVSAKEILGRTACFNPGSDYRTGHLQGVFLKINQHGSLEFDVMTHERDCADAKSMGGHIRDALLSSIPLFGTPYSNIKNNMCAEETLRILKRLESSIDTLKQNSPTTLAGNNLRLSPFPSPEKANIKTTQNEK